MKEYIWSDLSSCLLSFDDNNFPILIMSIFNDKDFRFLKEYCIVRVKLGNFVGDVIYFGWFFELWKL
jgi:hypothetical protein